MPVTVTFFFQGEIYAVRGSDAKDIIMNTITDDTARGQQLHRENKITHHLKIYRLYISISITFSRFVKMILLYRLNGLKYF